MIVDSNIEWGLWWYSIIFENKKKSLYFQPVVNLLKMCTVLLLLLMQLRLASCSERKF